MNYGLDDAQWTELIGAIESVNGLDEVVLFGSRALGTHKATSDVDLFVRGPNVTPDVASRLYGRLNDETNLPFKFDVLHEVDLSPSLREHIVRYGVTIFER